MKSRAKPSLWRAYNALPDDVQREVPCSSPESEKVVTAGVYEEFQQKDCDAQGIEMRNAHAPICYIVSIGSTRHSSMYSYLADAPRH